MKTWLPIIGAIVVLAISGGVIYKFQSKSASTLKPAPTPSLKAIQLPAEKQPQVSISFSQDGYFATVSLSNLNASQLEYNLIYEATVKKDRIQTGVNSTANISGKSTFSQKQLLGSESSGKFTYHQNIENAVMELTLRDSAGRSIFTNTYPFEVSPGESISLTASN